MDKRFCPKNARFRGKLLDSVKITKILWLSGVQHLILYQHLAKNYGDCLVFYDIAKGCHGLVWSLFNAVFTTTFRN